MAFLRIKEIFGKEREIHPTLKRVAALEEIQRAWETWGVAILPKKTQKHIKSTVRVERYEKEKVFLRGEDAATVSLLTLSRENIRAALQRACRNRPIQEVVIRQ